MAVVSKRVEVCDVCRDVDRPVVERVRIAREHEAMRMLMVCAEHAGPVREALAQASLSRVIRRIGRSSKVVDLQEIEHLKQVRSGVKGRKAPSKASKRA